MGNQEAEQRSGHIILPACVLLLCIFLFLGAVYQFEPQCRGRIQPFFPLFGGISSRLDEAAEELRAGRPIKEAAEVFFRGVLGNVETDSY
ncbi:MAG: hypothetical protein ACI3XG_09855 [Faecousia sp.]